MLDRYVRAAAQLLIDNPAAGCCSSWASLL
jgi:hypothetical protein